MRAFILTTPKIYRTAYDVNTLVSMLSPAILCCVASTGSWILLLSDVLYID